MPRLPDDPQVSNMIAEGSPIEGAFAMPAVRTLGDLFLNELRDLYDAEKQLTEALPEMADAATSDELRRAFEEHLVQTHNHIDRLEYIFEAHGESPAGKKCVAMTGLIRQGNEIAADTEEHAIRDAGLISAAQKAEHYEISAYGSARTHAELIGNPDAARLLQQTLDEEKQADERLNDIAKTKINCLASGQTPVRSRTAGRSDSGGI
jgi:ferritin-like metal-binding protein YciE